MSQAGQHHASSRVPLFGDDVAEGPTRIGRSRRPGHGGGGVGVKVCRRPSLEGVPKRVAQEIEGRRLRRRFGIPARQGDPRLVRLEHLRLKALQALGGLGVAAEQRFRDQVEQGRQGAVVRRHAMLEAGGARRDVLRRRDQFGGGAETQPIKLADRPLGQGVIGPDRLDDVALPQNDAHRPLRRRRKDIDDLAEDGDLARLVDAVVLDIAGHGREPAKRLTIQPIAPRHLETGLGMHRGGRKTLADRFRRDDQKSGPLRGGQQPGHGVHASRHDIARRRGAIVGETVPRRQENDFRVRRETAQGPGDLIRPPFARRQVNARSG